MSKMTKQEYWDALCNKAPELKKENVRITTRSLKDIVFQSFEMGVKSVPVNNMFPWFSWKRFINKTN